MIRKSAYEWPAPLNGAINHWFILTFATYSLTSVTLHVTWLKQALTCKAPHLTKCHWSNEWTPRDTPYHRVIWMLSGIKAGHRALVASGHHCNHVKPEDRAPLRVCGYRTAPSGVSNADPSKRSCRLPVSEDVVGEEDLVRLVHGRPFDGEADQVCGRRRLWLHHLLTRIPDQLWHRRWPSAQHDKQPICGRGTSGNEVRSASEDQTGSRQDRDNPEVCWNDVPCPKAGLISLRHRLHSQFRCTGLSWLHQNNDQSWDLQSRRPAWLRLLNEGRTSRPDKQCNRRTTTEKPTETGRDGAHLE